MAEEEKEETSGEEGGEKKKSPLLLIIVAIVALLLIVGIVVVVLLMSGGDEPDQMAPKQAQQRTVSQAAESTLGPIVALDQFIVNLLSDSGRRYLKVEVNLEINDEGVSGEIENKKPMIRDVIIQTLSAKTFDEISNETGKSRLKEEIASKLNEQLVDGYIKREYFTNFVIQ